VLPQLERDRYRIDGELTPPCSLVTLAVKLTVMDAMQWYRELVAYPAPERGRLHEAKMMVIGRHPAAHEARLPGYEFPVLLVAQADGFAQCTYATISARFNPGAEAVSARNTLSAADAQVIEERFQVRLSAFTDGHSDEGRPILRASQMQRAPTTPTPAPASKTPMSPRGRLIS
jgi:hypothetical protein